MVITSEIEYTHYPTDVPLGYEPRLDEAKEIHIACNSSDLTFSKINNSVSFATVLKAAWSIVLSQYAGSNDVAFGTSPTKGKEQENFDYVPLEIGIDWKLNIWEWLLSIEARVKQSEEHGNGPEKAAASGIRNIFTMGHKTPVVANSPVALFATCFGDLDKDIRFKLAFDSHILHPNHVENMAHQFEFILMQIIQGLDDISNTRLEDLDTVSGHSKAKIWSWNSRLPTKVSAWIPAMFAVQLSMQPHKVAVHAWDGQLTYKELDQQSSLLGTWLLRNKIAARGTVLPICFDKTMLTTVVLLAAAKIGAVFIMIDPHQPHGRLQSILSKFGFYGMLARSDTRELAISLTRQPVYLVDDVLLANLAETSTSDHCDFIPGSPDDPLYIVFTSGSTGEPKGITISHANLSSAVAHQARAIGFANSRTFDSSSYSFDAYVCNTFHTLLTGGCLCVPSEHDRMNDLENVLQKMQVDFIQLTPSTSGILDPNNLPCLRTLVLTGEKMTKAVLDPWLATGRVRIVNAYGPSECTIMCSANTNVTCIEEATNIGRGLGATLWIADLNDATRLAPVGAVGELLIDGPIIGQGYLENEQKTKASLLHLQQGFLPGIATSPCSEVFRTGDLARYNSDGSICFIGRADTQIKINGQRVEIGEIEHRLGDLLTEDMTAIVEAVPGLSGKKQLVAFVHGSSVDLDPNFVSDLNRRLSQVLPRYMIPSAYFSLSSIPKTSSGKTDRKALRTRALNSPDQLIDGQVFSDAYFERDLTQSEVILREVWSDVLGVDAHSISSRDDFFARGGDSLAAIRVVAMLHRAGFGSANVASIFKYSVLSVMASNIITKGTDKATAAATTILPFSLLQPTFDLQLLIEEAARVCGCQAADIEDMYSCTPVQEEMMVLGARNPKDFITQKTVALPPQISLKQAASALDKLLLAVPILRTRIIEDTNKGILVQVLTKDKFEPEVYTCLETCLEAERQRDMGLGSRLFKFATVETHNKDKGSYLDSVTNGFIEKNSTREDHGGNQCIVFTMHHAVYDGWTMNLVSEELSRLCSGSESVGIADYKHLVHHLQILDKNVMASFWKSTLKDFHVMDYPSFPEPAYKPRATAIEEQRISGIDWKNTKAATPTTLIQAAWALVLSKLSGSRDVVYGTTLLGRQASLPGIHMVAGPTLASVPVRTFVNWRAMTTSQLLRAVQEQTVDSIPHMHYGIRNIQQLGYDTDLACRFRTFIVIQPEEKLSTTDVFRLGKGVDDIAAFNSYALMLEFSLVSDGVVVRASFDETVCSSTEIFGMLADLDKTLSLLTAADTNKSLWELPLLTEAERNALVSDENRAADGYVTTISNQLRQYFSHGNESVAVELVETAALPKQLVGFVTSTGATLDNQLLQAAAEARSQLAVDLPRHMLPAKFIAVESIPLHQNGSVDREKLRAIARDFPAESFVDISSIMAENTMENKPQTKMEIVLREIWSTALNIDESSIGRESSFLQLGGDSLSAMRAVSAARKRGYNMTVAQIFRSPHLMNLAKLLTMDENKKLRETIDPFSLARHGVDKEALGLACELHPSLIEDAYPCSPLQEALMAKTARKPEMYVSKNVSILGNDVDIERLHSAWDSVAAIAPILRTRIVESTVYGLLQVVTTGGVSWFEYDDGTLLLPAKMGFGEPLMRFDVVKTASDCHLHTTVHHAVHDRWSASLILEQVERLYKGEAMDQKLLPYNYFIRHVLDAHAQEQMAHDFWQEYFAELDAPDFPKLPNSLYQTNAQSICQKRLCVTWPKLFTPTTTLKAAFTLMIAQYSGSSDVVFGVTLMGRQASLPGIDLVAGPTIATVPFRSRIDWRLTAAQYLESLQEKSVEMISFEHYGLAQIQRLGPEAKRACETNASLVIQPPERASSSDLFGLQLNSDSPESVNEQPFALECTLSDNSDEILLNLNFDENVIDGALAERMLSQLQHLLSHLASADLDIVSLKELCQPNERDLKEIWKRNVNIPSASAKSVPDMIAEHVKQQPISTAIHAWDGCLTYSELYRQAKKLAYFLVVKFNVSTGKIVPICTEKSVTAPVAMLAVILAGGAAVTMDPAQPSQRLSNMIESTEATIVLASNSTVSLLRDLEVCQVVCVDVQVLASLPEPCENFKFPAVSSDDAFYINFTSGSTGTPKGVIVTHGNCAASVQHQSDPLGFNKSTRALDLASYSFDVVWEMLIQVLCAGGCLCIPLDDDRLNNIPKAIQTLNVNLLDTTPSLARTLIPKLLPSVKRVIFGGEALAMDDIYPWTDCGIDVVNAYGPSECTSSSTIARYGVEFTDAVNLGRCYGLTSWVVSCNGSESLAPIGGVGELILEGPLVGSGYLQDDEKTLAAFTNDPIWLSHSELNARAEKCGRFYKTGDLVRYDSQGMLAFEGRKDTQVKIRGQRVELNEIEIHARRVLSGSTKVVAQILHAQSSTEAASSALVLFIDYCGDMSDGKTQLEIESDISTHLAQSLPKYMIPSMYIFTTIPILVSGKVDRRKLAETGSAIWIDRLCNQLTAKRQLETACEKQIARLWAAVLGGNCENIGGDSSFTDLGGDSLTAIRLVGAGREEGLPLSVATIFQYPQLSDLAAKMELDMRESRTGRTSPVSDESHPSSGIWVSDETDTLPGVEVVADALGVAVEKITDVRPLTAFQKYALPCALKKPRTEWTYLSLLTSQTLGASELKSISRKMVETVDMLRCIFLQYETKKYTQVFLSELEPDIEHITTTQSLDVESKDACMVDWAADITMPSSLLKFFILENRENSKTQLILRIPHAQYDGFSLGPLAEAVTAVCDSRVPQVYPFAGYLNDAEKIPTAAYDFWSQLLQDSPQPTRVGASTMQLDASTDPGWRHYSCRQVSMARLPTGVTPTTFFCVLWAKAIFGITGISDVVFGRAVTGRAAERRHEDAIGPCLNLVPIRVRFEPTQSSTELLANIQSQIASSIEYENIGFPEMVRKCTQWPDDTAFGSVLYYQAMGKPGVTSKEDRLGVAIEAIPLHRPDPPEPPRLDVVPLANGRYELQLMVHERDIDAEEAEKLLDEMEKGLS